MPHEPSFAIIRSDDEYIKVTDVLTGKHDTALKFTAQYAALSAIVYGDNRPEFADITNDWHKIDLQFGNYRPDTKAIWLKGLKVESYYKKEGEIVYVAIVFRGTRFRKLNDWYANANWVTRFIPFVNNAYKQTLLQINPYVSAIEDFLKAKKVTTNGETLKFTATGHSLGGGLAQQAAYASEKIETVFAYDPSPVTGYQSVEKQQRSSNCKNLNIYRIWEKGEILLYLRLITKTARKLTLKPNINPRIVEVRFDFVIGKGGIEEHSMANLALSLLEVEKENALALA